MTVCKNVHIKIACKVSNLHKTETSNSLETLTSFAQAHSNFVKTNQKNWIFSLEQISPSARQPTRSGLMVTHFSVLLMGNDHFVRYFALLKNYMGRSLLWKHSKEEKKSYCFNPPFFCCERFSCIEKLPNDWPCFELPYKRLGTLDHWGLHALLQIVSLKMDGYPKCWFLGGSFVFVIVFITKLLRFCF